jgi:uncharacterized membrane protein YbaN (DUF454 family)
MTRNRFTRLLYLGLGWLCVGLGAMGIILPVLPTTPFLLVALWAFSRSSEALAERLRNHATFGALIRGWQDHGAIPVKAKALSVVMMTAMLAYAGLWSHAPAWAVWLMAATLAGVAVYILTRPHRGPEP